MKHPHYDMIVAKAANMDLVVFSKGSGEWIELHCMPRWGDNEYFLCLPQHKEACLHWLNGGKVEGIRKHFDSLELAMASTIAWSVNSTFMKDSIELRIKPRKEKRWIASCGNFITTLHYPSLDECKDATGDGLEWQYHEIEVEV